MTRLGKHLTALAPLAVLPLVAALLLPDAAAASSADPPPVASAWTVSWMSQPRSGVPGPDAYAYGPSISADGRAVTFSATTRLEGDGSAFVGRRPRAFLRRLGGAAPVRVAVAPDGARGNAQDADLWPGNDLTDDGRTLAFASLASNLVPGDTNGAVDVFVRDLATGSVRLVSHTPQGGPADGGSSEPQISGDGRWVLYTSEASDLTGSGRTSRWNLYDARTDRTTALEDVVAAAPRLAGDGSAVAFETYAQLVPSDTDRSLDGYVLDLRTGVTSLVGVTDSGRSVHAPSVSVSDDGARVAFASGDLTSVYVRDLTTGHTTRVPLPAGSRVDRYGVSLSGDGHRLAMQLLLPGANDFAATVTDVRGQVLYSSHPGAGQLSLDRRGACLAFQTTYPEASADPDTHLDVYTACQP